ncbi:FK506-binding protein 4 [Smittium culicis]|uniref:peptidylprolyl isomerase n=1 Tax=Smittium culicis TaxID=133412 RepID=A0A1R1XMX4_9FUNG|nr:FK506-binding protein 4 [Smittium culicis]
MSEYIGFWGLSIQPGKTYTQTVEASFRVSNAALGPDSSSQSKTCLIVSVDDKKFVLCSLIPEKIEQAKIDLVISEGEQVTFESTGDNEIHLVGNYIDNSHSHDDDSEYDSEEEDYDSDELESMLSNGMIDSGDFDSEDDVDYDIEELDSEDEAEPVYGKIEEVEEEKPAAPLSKAQKRKLAAEAKAAAAAEAKQDTAEPASKKSKKKAKAAEQAKPEEKAKPVKAQDKKKEVQEEKKKEQSNKRVLDNGLIIEDKKVGSGQPVKNGNKVGMYYIGKLASNNRQFDACTKGKPFNFTLGKGQVIKGWDLGIAGMKKGGERRLTIPAALAYGKRGAPPDIPGNATLIFDVRLSESR